LGGLGESAADTVKKPQAINAIAEIMAVVWDRILISHLQLSAA
jgi:hypothetical protein